MHVVLILVALTLVIVNAFGSWAVSRRKPAVAQLFLVAAMVLTVAAVAYAFRDRVAWWVLLVGTALGYLASFLNARLVIGKVVWPYHLLRAAVLAGVLVAARWLAR
ncbi:MAG: hypothetical protein H3C53_08045 [Trueperaceae bacterium]|nr:hypothetical protein [Trueperaceae bacterium]